MIKLLWFNFYGLIIMWLNDFGYITTVSLVGRLNDFVYIVK